MEKIVVSWPAVETLTDRSASGELDWLLTSVEAVDDTVNVVLDWVPATVAARPEMPSSRKVRRLGVMGADSSEAGGCAHAPNWAGARSRPAGGNEEENSSGTGNFS